MKNLIVTVGLILVSAFANAQVNPEIAKILASAETTLGITIKVNSGYRTAEHNKEVGGVPNSSHLKGLAVDVAMPRNGWRPLVRVLRSLGVKRIGIYKNHIHFDVDDSKPNATWLIY